MELGNWPIKVQLGSTNSKGLPVLFQGSHQGFLLNNQLIHYDGSNGHAHCHPLQVNKTREASSIQPTQHDARQLQPINRLDSTIIALRPSKPETIEPRQPAC